MIKKKVIAQAKQKVNLEIVHLTNTKKLDKAEKNIKNKQKNQKHDEAKEIKKAKDKAVSEVMQEIKLRGPIKAKLIGDKVMVEEDYELFLPFYDRSSFGEVHGVKTKRIELGLSEGLYLMERGKLAIFEGKKIVDLEKYVKLAKKSEKNFWTRYRVYRELRTRGYTLKTALKFGADFRVYRRGVKPGEDHAKWVLFCADENDGLTWRQFSAMNRVAHSTRKSLLVGVVDDEGDVTYYNMRWIKP
jgi:tRNA-intron endonuclease, archaea type